MDWLSGYSHRQQITIDATVAGEQTNYQMKLTVHKGVGDSSGDDVYLKNHALSWSYPRYDTDVFPRDIRFTKADGITELDYWIEFHYWERVEFPYHWPGIGPLDPDTAFVWIEFDTIPAEGSRTFYIYYGKVDASTTSSRGNTFLQATGGGYTFHMSHILTPPVMIEAMLWCDIPQVGRFYFGVCDEGNLWSPPPLYSYAFLSLDHEAPGYGKTRKGDAESSSGEYEVAGMPPRKYKILWLADEVKFWYDEDNYKGSLDSNIPTDPLGLTLWTSSTVHRPKRLFVLAREYVSPEPTWGDWGDEEGPVTVPTATTEVANNLAQTQSNLNGILTDDGDEACDCWFEWGLTDSYGNTTATQSGKVTDDVISQIISGLEAGTLYHFRFVAENSAGTGYGDDRTFVTESPALKEYSLAQPELLLLLGR